MMDDKAKAEPASDWARSKAYGWWMDWFGGIEEFTHDTRGINQIAALLREVAEEARREALEQVGRA